MTCLYSTEDKKTFLKSFCYTFTFYELSYYYPVIDNINFDSKRDYKDILLRFAITLQLLFLFMGKIFHPKNCPEKFVSNF